MPDKPSDPKCLDVPGKGYVVGFMKEGEPFHLGDQEKLLFDGYSNEQTDIGGTTADYWTINAVDTVKDPLYGESIDRKFEGPFRFHCVFVAAEQTPIVTEEGLAASYDSKVNITRLSFETASCPNPGPGDVLRVWNLPFYVAQSTVEPNPLPGSGFFFDVLDANPDGYINDSPTFVRWTLSVKRRTSFTPERRLVRP